MSFKCTGCCDRFDKQPEHCHCGSNEFKEVDNESN